MDLPELHTLQDEPQIPYLPKTLRWSKPPRDFLVTLDNKQMESGFVSPILDTMDLPIEYIDLGWIIGLRDRLRSFNAGIWIEDAFPRYNVNMIDPLWKNFLGFEESLNISSEN